MRSASSFGALFLFRKANLNESLHLRDILIILVAHAPVMAAMGLELLFR